uniref:Uncharacterized protein n=1 Tax=Arundo donax TaxID=35708 RepID=A0A0A9EXQ3_ARUDO
MLLNGWEHTLSYLLKLLLSLRITGHLLVGHHQVSSSLKMLCFGIDQNFLQFFMAYLLLLMEVRR